MVMRAIQSFTVAMVTEASFSPPMFYPPYYSP